MMRLEDLPPEIREPAGEAPGTPASVIAADAVVPLEDLEREMVRRALEQAGGNQTQAAELLGISRDAMRYKMKKHGVL